MQRILLLWCHPARNPGTTEMVSRHLINIINNNNAEAVSVKNIYRNDDQFEMVL